MTPDPIDWGYVPCILCPRCSCNCGAYCHDESRHREDGPCHPDHYCTEPQR